jgi:hypothetical protein
MFQKKENSNSLDLPPIAKKDNNAIEILRVWASPGAPQEIILRNVWKNPAAWGLMLVDLARHVANEYANHGLDRNEVLSTIKEYFEKEWNSPTDEAREVKRG